MPPTMNQHSDDKAENDARPKGYPVQVLLPSDNHTFELNIEALERIIQNENIRNKNVAVISVAGAFRKGKSFILDFFLRYLNAHGSSDWLGDENTPLQGFSWRRGSQRETTGIWIWSEPYLVNDEKVALLLMDTQGVFDNQSTYKQCATVFGLSTLLSSVLVYNIPNNIQQDDLQSLHLFAEYGRLVASEDGAKPFQKLEFLVRDWPWPDEYEYGEKGGEKLLENIFQITKEQPTEIQKMHDDIKECFENIGCYLMPNPGKKAATDPNFKGKLADLEQEFKDHLLSLAPRLLRAENVIVKQIHDNPITAMGWMEYFKKYVEIYQDDTLPEPISIWQATAEIHNMAAVSKAKELYEEKTELTASTILARQLYGTGTTEVFDPLLVFGGQQPYMDPHLLKQEKQDILEAVLQVFDKTAKVGGQAFSQQYRAQLEADINKQFNLIWTRYEQAWQELMETVEKAKRDYARKMENVCGDKIEKYVKRTTVNARHAEYMGDALEILDTRKLQQKLRDNLQQDIKECIDRNFAALAVKNLEKRNCCQRFKECVWECYCCKDI